MGGELGTLDYVQHSLMVSWHENENMFLISVMSLKVIHFLVHFSDIFLSKKTYLCAEIWNN